MPALLPLMMLRVVALLAVVLVWPRLREGQSLGHLFLEAFGTTLVATAIVWAAWAELWWVTQHAALRRVLP